MNNASGGGARACKRVHPRDSSISHAQRHPCSAHRLRSRLLIDR